MPKPTIAVFSGPRATITNSPPLVTSNKARRDGERQFPESYDHLIPQTLHEPVKVKIKRFSGHPLERDAEEVYHGDDAYFTVTLEPEDGPYPLPYVARRDDGSDEGVPFEPDDKRDPTIDHGGRQFFYPDASRVFEEIDRTVYGRSDDGTGNALSGKADFEFVRVRPPGGYTRDGEVAGEDFFPYEPPSLSKSPRLGDLARIANDIQRTLDRGEFAGGIWLEGSSRLEETTYWLNLLIDTELPLVGVAANRKHGTLSNDGDRNIVDAVDYIVSGQGSGLGTVCVLDQLVYAARDFKKGDARPGGFKTVGGQGGTLGSVKADVRIQYEPAYRRTSTSAVNLRELPAETTFLDRATDPAPMSVRIKDDDGRLDPAAVPRVSLIKDAAYTEVEPRSDPEGAVDVMARIEQARQEQESDDGPPFHGLVFEGSTPYAGPSASQAAAFEVAAYQGIPVVRVTRSDPGGFVPPDDGGVRPAVVGGNLDANKARLLLMASLLKLGRLPKAADPRSPRAEEQDAVRDKLVEFQAVFDSH